MRPLNDRSPAPGVRVASAGDRPALEALEAASFDHDRIAPRSWSRLLRRSTALVLVVPDGTAIAGALVLLFRRGTRVARIYSIAVAAPRRGTGIGRALIGQAILAAAARECTTVRLETRIDNLRAQALFAGQGFAITGVAGAYYHDGTAALRLERPIHSPYPC